MTKPSLFLAAATCLWIAGAQAAPVVLEISGWGWQLGSGWGSACKDKGCDHGDDLLNVDWSARKGLKGASLSFDEPGETKEIIFGKASFSHEDEFIDIEASDELDLAAWLQFGQSASKVFLPATVTIKQDAPKEHGDRRGELAIDFQKLHFSTRDGARFELTLSGASWSCHGKKNCNWDSPEERTISAEITLLEFSSAQAAVAEAAIPEPSSLPLLLLGLMGLGMAGRRLDWRGAQESTARSQR